MKLEFNRDELIKAAGGRSLFDPGDFGLAVNCDEINIEKIGLVGFHAGLTDDGKLSNPLDRQLLRYALCSAEINSNLNLSSTVTAEIINADDCHGGRDYFQLDDCYDLLLLGNIYIPNNPARMRESGSLWGIGGPDCYVSPLCDHVKGWPEKAEELSTKAIFTVSCGASLDISFFENYGNYTVLQHETYDNGKVGIAIHKDKTRLVA